jgi:hypothetical protein
MGNQTGTGEGRELSVQLDINLDRQPVTGRLRIPGGGDERFVGWLGFVDALRRVHAGSEPPVAVTDNQPAPRDEATTESSNREEPQ